MLTPLNIEFAFCKYYLFKHIIFHLRSVLVQCEMRLKRMCVSLCKVFFLNKKKIYIR